MFQKVDAAFNEPTGTISANGIEKPVGSRVPTQALDLREALLVSKPARLSPGWVVLGVLALFLGVALGLLMSFMGAPT